METKITVVRALLVAVLILAAFAVPPAARAGGGTPTICRVDADAVGPTHDGTTWTYAYTTLQEALQNVLCGETWVAAHVYKPGSLQTDTFTIHAGLTVYGGFAGGETLRSQRNPAVNVTILSGDIDNDDLSVGGIDETWESIRDFNSYHVVTIDGITGDVTLSTVLDGFTITGGNANIGPSDSYGGGLRCQGTPAGNMCSPTLSNLVFRGNSAIVGGGLFNDGSAGGVSSPWLTNVVFRGNRGEMQGGGMYNNGVGGTSSPSLVNVVFESNTALYGGGVYNAGSIYNAIPGISNPTFTNVTFNGNTATNRGGAVYNSGSEGTSSPSFAQTTFSTNSSGWEGGAVYNDATSGTSSPSFTEVSFIGNHAGQDGGALYNYANMGTSSPSFSRVTFSTNSAVSFGGAILNLAAAGGNSSPTFANVTFFDNSSTSYSGGAVYDWASGGTSSPYFRNVTFSSNHADLGTGGALYNRAQSGGTAAPMLWNVILWGDSASSGSEIAFSTGALPGVSSSVVQGGCESTGSNCGPGNLDTDPLLAPLKNNGGYAKTMALVTGSSAIDTGNAVTCADAASVNNQDERGLSRPVDGNFDGTAVCDIGAYEYQGHLFADVPVVGKAWMEPWIEMFYYNGITTGCGIGPLIYCPENNVTRAEMAVFLLRAKHGAGYAPPAATHSFSDMPVAGKEWMEAWVDQFYAEGMTTGCGLAPLRFCPEQNVTRAEMAVFVLRAVHGLGWVPPDHIGIFLDMPVLGKEWMEDWVDQFYNEGITTGCGAGPLYCPENNVTRAEMAVFIGRAYSLYP